MNQFTRIDRDSLEAHERGVRRDLERLTLPGKAWPAKVTAPDGGTALDAVVVGAGMNGIAAAGALIFKGVRNIAVVERSAPGEEGPWLSFARMDTLRSPKTLTGPAFGIPSLTFRAWHEARYGVEAWEALYKIPNAMWVDYLTWLQRMLALPISHGVNVERIEPEGRLLRVRTRSEAGERTLWARRVVLATGRGGAGGFYVPGFIDAALWPDRAAHTNEAIDFAGLAGKSIAILGGGASAWDNAATALEQSAARVDMYVRRRTLPQVNKGRGSAFPGMFHGWHTLSDAQRWELAVYLNDLQAPPPHETVNRALKQAGFHIHLGTQVTAARRAGDAVEVDITGEATPRRHDFLIVGTGFLIEVARIAELAAVKEHVASWGDRYPAPEGLHRPDLAAFPYLGPGFELTEKTPGACPALMHIHLFNYGAHVSHSGIASDIPGISVAAERLSIAIATSLFREDIGHVRQLIEAFDEPELAGTPFFDPSAFRTREA